MAKSYMDDTRPIGGAGKKKKRKRPGGVSLMYWAFVLGVSMLLSAVIIGAVNDVFAFEKPDLTAVIEVPANASIGDVSKILKKADVISHPFLFRTFFSLTSEESSLKPGKYEANANLDYRALTRLLTRKSTYRETVRVTIPEGYELSQIVKLLVDKGVCEKAKLEDTLANYDFEYTFLKGIQKGTVTRLEGYLYPDTYEFYTNDDAVNVVKKMLTNFDNKFTEAMRARAKELNMSISEVITLASIVEREATSTDRDLISSVFHNRLKSGRYPRLQSCATVQYAMGTRKERLSVEDTKIDSPYNTYQIKGLPPGPIASPGNESIEAALYPADTSYLFFALQEDGTHKFSKTYAEHQSLPNVNPN